MEINRESLISVLSALNENGVLPYVILVGSWAEFLYGETALLEGFSSYGKTTDMDFLVRNLRKPPQKVSIMDSMERAGFLYEEDYITGNSKFVNEELEIEFLICQMGDGTKELPATNIGVKAQQITHMDVANRFFTTVEYEGFKINIPIPECYVIQKMIINHKRGYKQIPDQEKVASLIPFIDIDMLNTVFRSLSRKEKQRVEEYIRNNSPELRIESGKKVCLVIKKNS
ncbi:MAG: hypothetical protein IJ796_10185 [Lachnospiraceae bacterium]|nr:hypothetical protein [Lachnospiraceae bacterium]